MKTKFHGPETIGPYCDDCTRFIDPDFCIEHGYDNCTKCHLCYRCFTEKQWNDMPGVKNYECDNCYTGPAGY